MRRKRKCSYGWTALASIALVMLGWFTARVANAENQVKLNPFARQQPAGVETTPAVTDAPSKTDVKQQRPSPTRISAPEDVSRLAGANGPELTPAQTNAVGTLPDGWVLAIQSVPDDALPQPGEARQARTNQAADEGAAEESSETLESPLEETKASAVVPTSELPTPDPEAEASDAPDWWKRTVDTSILNRPKWVKFNLETILIDTLQNSPLIKSVGYRTSVANERIVQQDAAFDPLLLLGVDGGQTNEPVGNTLTTGGGLTRLREESFNVRGGFRRNTRQGGNVELTQRLGLLNSNSTFFSPQDQGNARLNLSLTQPLLARGGQVYNERLLTQARIDHGIAWQDMRGAVERRIAEVMSGYWRLYELRCHLIQQQALLARGEYIEQIVRGRAGFDASRVELAKTEQRVARRTDRLIEVQAELAKQQSRLATLIGSDLLYSAESQLEMIPVSPPVFPDTPLNLRDAVVQGLTYRPEVKAAAGELESAALEVQVTRAELVPQLNAVVDTYLAALNGNYQMGQALIDQFSESGPGFAAGFEFEMPRGRRAARSRHREAHLRYRQRGEDLREAIQKTRWEIESALIDVQRASAQKVSKQKLLVTAVEEETVLTRRWEMMAGDGGTVGVVLENLLDAQQRRTDAEREWVTARSDYLIALIELQRNMGTLLITEAITPVRNRSDCAIDFVRGQPVGQSVRDNLEGSQATEDLEAFDQFLDNVQQPSTTQPQVPASGEQP